MVFGTMVVVSWLPVNSVGHCGSCIHICPALFCLLFNVAFACLCVVFGSDCVCCFGGLAGRLGYVGMLVCRLLIVLSSLWWIGVRFGVSCCLLFFGLVG